VHEGQPGHYVIAGAINPKLLAAVAAWCAANGILAESIAVQRQTLEDRFLELTGRALR
jgi:ABC-2 type transport system ATP-binding protein